MGLTQEKIADLMAEVTYQVGMPCSGASAKDRAETNAGLGIFVDMEEAICAAGRAQKELIALSMEQRCQIINGMRRAALKAATSLAQKAVDETGFGRLEDKTAKNILAARKTPGIEDLVAHSFTGDYGLTLVENAPYGVIGAITPSTNPVATIINNSIGMVAGGNAVVFNTHPNAKEVSVETIELLNRAIAENGGPTQLLCTVKSPTLDSCNALMRHPQIRMLAVTGGEAVVHAALKSGKKVIAAGPGNPPVIVDDTADIEKAARDIVRGASFDNNILCIAEKEVFVFESVARRLICEMEKNGAYLLNHHELKAVMNLVLVQDGEGKWMPNKRYVGRSAGNILRDSGIPGREEVKVILADATLEHPLVMTEMLMPVLPVVKVKDLQEAIRQAVVAESGNHHTAIMHSENISNLTAAAKALDTTIFVKNAPSFAGLGFEGEGYTTLTIATPTGEGLTSAKDFVRKRRCTMSGAFRII